MQTGRYDDDYVRALFDRMGRTYDLVNVISSFGFSAMWRRLCVRNASINRGDRVCDLMSGSGECWRYILSAGAQLVSIDFSPVMVARQFDRRTKRRCSVDVRLENALSSSLPDESIDCVVAAFGLKTLDREGVRRLACEIRRILRPGGRFSFIEISDARDWILGSAYRWYIRSLIPVVGKVLLGDIECYRMLNTYTVAFGDCSRVAPIFSESGLRVNVRRHFYGCASSIVGAKDAEAQPGATDNLDGEIGRAHV